MALMNGDIGGEVTVAAVTTFCENLLSGTAIKPGDVIKTMNEKSIEVLDTEVEGRLILTNVLHHIISKYRPSSLVDLATKI